MMPLLMSSTWLYLCFFNCLLPGDPLSLGLLLLSINPFVVLSLFSPIASCFLLCPWWDLYYTSCFTFSYLMQEFLSSSLHISPCSQDCQINFNIKVALYSIPSSDLISSLFFCLILLFWHVPSPFLMSDHLCVTLWPTLLTMCIFFI